MIDIIRRSNTQIYQWSYNTDFVGVPLKIVGPEVHFLQDSIYEMARDFAEIKDEADEELYNEDEILTDKEAKSELINLVASAAGTFTGAVISQIADAA